MWAQIKALLTILSGVGKLLSFIANQWEKRQEKKRQGALQDEHARIDANPGAEFDRVFGPTDKVPGPAKTGPPGDKRH